MSYEPLDGVWAGTDAELLRQMLVFYWQEHDKDCVIFPRYPRLLDATANDGRIWGDRADLVTVGIDLGPGKLVSVRADNRSIPFRSEWFDVVVYDPPHLSGGPPAKSKDLGARFGQAQYSWRDLRDFKPFLREAYRVLNDSGLVFAKLCDEVQNHRYQWTHLDFVTQARETGFTPCDMIVKVRKGPMRSTRWVRARHARKRHAFWIVLRKGGRCE